MSDPDIVFVDENNVVIGSGSKHEAVQRGIAHRVVRIFLFNTRGEILLQKRSMDKGSYPGLWDQSVAGHVDVGEEYDDAALREMKEEMGGENIPLTKVGTYYSEEPEKGIFKKRFNMLYTGVFEGSPVNNPEEVSEFRWVAPSELDAWMREKPEEFTPGSVRAFSFLKKQGGLS
jgi:16S rRNA (adenine1518-N6/adenine1519-N6)-dimethyltransferase